MCWYNARFHGTQLSFQPSSVERGFLQKSNCWILSETHYGFIVAYLSHNGSYCMCNEEISSMLKMRFCTPMLLYQSMLLVVLPDTDFNTPPPKNSNKKTPQNPNPECYISSKQQQKEKSEASIICWIIKKVMVGRTLTSEFVILARERICHKRARNTQREGSVLYLGRCSCLRSWCASRISNKYIKYV